LPKISSRQCATARVPLNRSKPVTLTPGTTYVVSYHTTIYSCDQNYFANAYIRVPLTAPASSVIGGNGVYAYGSSSSFPTQAYNSSNYWVDVAFLQTSSTSSLFSASATPANVTINDPNSLELGVKFKTAAAGTITGIRFYKGPQNTGTHVANLWSATGALLATAFTSPLITRTAIIRPMVAILPTR
jgi:hypothetical protein